MKTITAEEVLKARADAEVSSNLDERHWFKDSKRSGFKYVLFDPDYLINAECRTLIGVCRAYHSLRLSIGSARASGCSVFSVDDLIKAAKELSNESR